MSEKPEKNRRSEQNHCFENHVISWDTSLELVVPSRALVPLFQLNKSELRWTGHLVGVEILESNNSYLTQILKAEIFVNQPLYFCLPEFLSGDNPNSFQLNCLLSGRNVNCQLKVKIGK